MKTIITAIFALAATSGVSAFTFSNGPVFGVAPRSASSALFSEEPEISEPVAEEPAAEVEEPKKDYSSMSPEELAADALKDAGLLKK
eukprot:CAMPEP_0194298992 /NCGR_PEP_ID=MMETSP0169-20130528/60473_1 /TAXON_ID=218684 /ORGANISM="Corethron pennatum, Strain L29A3" /LENGTH=86 /DNA_ID=CAMNT_0039049045 /DNA_START=44 /DNA_END=304 /DNA_ORIENTATION=-